MTEYCFTDLELTWGSWNRKHGAIILCGNTAHIIMTESWLKRGTLHLEEIWSRKLNVGFKEMFSFPCRRSRAFTFSPKIQYGRNSEHTGRKNNLILSIQYHFSPAGNMIFCRSEPSRGLCVSNHQKRLKPGSNKNLYARSNFRSIISDSCTLKILDGAAWRQTCSERGTLVQQPWRTDLAANKEPLIYLLPLSFLYADWVFLMITRSWWVFTYF